MNRGSEYYTIKSKNDSDASMRPRFMNRGSAGGGTVDGFSGFGFNEAPIHESGKSGIGN